MHVLIFESEDAFSKELKDAFITLSATAEVSNDGPKGLELALTRRPDLILLTLELPGMNGFLVCKKIKKNAELKDVPLVILSSEASEETFQQHSRLRTHAQCYIHKPVSIGDILVKIGDLPALSELFKALSDGAVSKVPPEILLQGADVVYLYLQELANKDKGVALYEAKLLVLGSGGVGKTSLCRRLVHDKFDPLEKTTRGVAVRERMEVSRWATTPTAVNHQLNINIWDFGGQEIYHSTHRFFLSHRAVYVIVWDGRQECSANQLEYWLRTIEGYAGSSPIILVQNKCDERIQEINLRELCVSFPQIAGFYQVSCRVPSDAPHSLSQLSEAIYNQALALEHVGIVWPRSWLQLRERVERATATLARIDDYYRLASELKIDHDTSVQLCRLLHDLGVVLYFSDDPVLRQVLILQPSWGTEAVYRVLDFEPIRLRGGILKEEDTDEIWRETCPPERYPVLLRLMANFGLMFRLVNSNDYLVTQLLPEEAPEVEGLADEKGTVFEYTFNFLPSSLIPQFLVRIHENILIRKNGQNVCWRHGAVISGFDSHAIVTAHLVKRIVRAIVKGPGAVELLAVIRRELDAAVRSYVNLNVVRKVKCCCGSHCEHRWSYEHLRRAYHHSVPKVLCESSLRYVRVTALLGMIEPIEDRLAPMTINNYGRLDMGNKNNTTNININGSTVGVVSTGKGSYSKGSIETEHSSSVQMKTLQEEIRELQTALIADQDNLREGVYEALSQFLRLARGIQAQGQATELLQSQLRQLLEDSWAQHVVDELKPGILPNASRAFDTMMKSPVLAAVVKGLLA